MRCYLVRHGQTLWNGENRLQGHSDLSLSPLGCEQAKRVGGYFSSLRSATRPFRLYTSHLKRSLETAQAITHHVGVAATIDTGLAEICLGAWEGLTPEEIDARFDGAYQLWRQQPSQVIIPGAESLEAFRGRVRRAFATMLARHPDDEALVVVSHGGVIASVLADCLEADYDQVLRRLVLDNASISAVECRPHPHHILWVNGTAHLVT